MPLGSILAAFLIAGLLFAVYRWSARHHSLRLPPAPKSNLILGHARVLSGGELWKTFYTWSRQLDSSVVSLRIFRQHAIVLNTYKAANDLLEVRSSIYSDRPTTTMYGELIGRKLAVFNISSQTPRFRAYRRLLHSSLNPRVITEYQELQTREMHVLLRNLAAEPERFVAHFRRNAGAVIMKLAYGWDVKDSQDRFIAIMQQVARESVEILKPGRWLVDTFPFLRYVPSWFPGASFKQKAARWRKLFNGIDMEPHSWAMDQIRSGSYSHSFTSQHMRPEDGHEPEGEEEDIVKWCSAALYAGGADTTVAVLTSFVLRMSLYPHIQQRAQAEIDRVIGKGRLPSRDDEASLPYVSAVVKEVLRVAPAVPLGLPHRVVKEDVYLGYRIPAGASIIANIWAMTHDPSLYPDPYKFQPSRFLLQPVQVDPRNIVFGFGRRSCPGAYLAEASIFLNVACILATFDILGPTGAGDIDEATLPYTSGVISHPQPFECRIIPRLPFVGSN